MYLVELSVAVTWSYRGVQSRALDCPGRSSKTFAENKSDSQSMAPAAAADPNQAQAGSKERVAVLCKRGDGVSTASVGLAPTWGTLAALFEELQEFFDAFPEKDERALERSGARDAETPRGDRRWPPRPPGQAEPRHRPIAQPQSRRRAAPVQEAPVVVGGQLDHPAEPVVKRVIRCLQPIPLCRAKAGDQSSSRSGDHVPF